MQTTRRRSPRAAPETRPRSHQIEAGEQVLQALVSNRPDVLSSRGLVGVGHILSGYDGQATTGIVSAIARTLVGNYVTSLDMAGASVTVCRADEEMLRLYDAPVSTPSLRWGC